MYLHFCFYFFHFNKVTGLLSNSNLFANEMLPCVLQGLSPNCVVPKAFFVGSPKISYSFEQSLELYGTSLLFLLINMYNLNMHVIFLTVILNVICMFFVHIQYIFVL